MQEIAIGWIAILSICAFAVMGYDKRQAVRREWRVPERQLWLLALAGGGIGAYFGMQTFRHKTRHTAFRIGFLLLALIDASLLLLLFGVRLPSLDGVLAVHWLIKLKEEIPWN
ncbi:hypothetical protein NCCP2716_20990 [Sporosarcina sp. NCCP-2716]|uniref:DUF1294 domain-containing protein n=1 Tax=Sporosarcina sp. NCCP-2716 TaxID=2943679 RepID=UPI00203AC8E5|nr:DUF1294 domain-containing protein [Sporosarcina sp. NCCP-2716]GKV69601.1 hypothetical protein NCCP2716_20990 [Sporosarcina sp. NCCP-2716]